VHCKLVVVQFDDVWVGVSAFPSLELGFMYDTLNAGEILRAILNFRFAT
jgi:hypothetical protein